MNTMKAQNRSVFERLYNRAKQPDQLPWHRAEPPDLLKDAMAARSAPGKALDVGCGAGTYSLYMARRGYQVTGVDFMPRAVEMLNQQAARDGLPVTGVQADITTWQAPHRYDIVLDVGCLHSFDASVHPTYKAQLLRWLAPGGDFVLVHFGRRGWWDRWPIGPKRVYRETLARLFAPELTLREYHPEKLKMIPIMGGNALVGEYWFRRGA